MQVAPQGPDKEEQVAEASAVECELEPAQARPGRIRWARLLKRVFDIDMQHCPNCGAGEPKIIAAILEVSPDANGPEDRWRLANASVSVPWRPVLEKILAHLGLDPQPPPRSPAREPGRHHAG